MKARSPSGPQPVRTHRFPRVSRTHLEAGWQLDAGQALPQGPILHCAQPCWPRLAALNLSPGRLGCPRREPGGEGPGESLCCSSTSIWKLSGSWDCVEGQRDGAHISAAGPWLAGRGSDGREAAREWQWWGGQSSPCPERKRGTSLIPGVVLGLPAIGWLPALWTPVPAGPPLLHRPGHAWCLLYRKRLCRVFCGDAGAALPRTRFFGPFPPSWAQAEPSHSTTSLRSN